MQKRFLNARSPLRLLEKGLPGGLGPGNLGVVIAGPGLELDGWPEDELRELVGLAGELAAEVWLEAPSGEEGPATVPSTVARFGELLSVILALEPGDGTVALRALKDHDNPDLEALHVALAPKTLLLVRN